MKRNFRLNPCDCGFHAFDYLTRRSGYAGASTFLFMDLAGQLDSAELAEALRRAMLAHPPTAAAASTSFWRGFPVWRFRGPVSPRYQFDDLSNEPDWVATAHRLFEQRFSEPLDLAHPPLVRLEHYRGPDEQHRLCLRWPHALMDGEGAQHFLREMERLANDADSALPDHLLPDGQAVDPLAGYGPLRKFRLFRQWLRGIPSGPPAPNIALYDRLPDRPADSRRLRCLHRVWSPEKVARMQANAKRVAPPGPALYTRYVAGCVLRALHRLHRAHNCALPVYAIGLPMRMPELAQRPVTGNYLISPTVNVAAECVENKRALAAEIERQSRAYLDRRQYLADWWMQRLAAQLRLPLYRWVVARHLRGQPALTGYSFLGELTPPLERFLGAEVTNLWSSGLVTVPPGWNPTFTRFRDRINFAMPWPEGAFPPEVVERYADWIEQEVFDE